MAIAPWTSPGVRVAPAALCRVLCTVWPSNMASKALAVRNEREIAATFALMDQSGHSARVDIYATRAAVRPIHALPDTLIYQRPTLFARARLEHVAEAIKIVNWGAGDRGRAMGALLAHDRLDLGAEIQNAVTERPKGEGQLAVVASTLLMLQKTADKPKILRNLVQLPGVSHQGLVDVIRALLIHDVQRWTLDAALSLNDPKMNLALAAIQPNQFLDEIHCEGVRAMAASRVKMSAMSWAPFQGMAP